MQTRSIKETIQARYSCRSYVKANIDKTVVGKLSEFIKKNNQCPFNSNPRFILESARDGDDIALKDLGTYGFVKKPVGVHYRRGERIGKKPGGFRVCNGKNNTLRHGTRPRLMLAWRELQQKRIFRQDKDTGA